MHKHMQIFEYPEDFTLFPDKTTCRVEDIPFRYNRIDHSDAKDPYLVDDLTSSYNLFLEFYRTSLPLQSDYVPHNVVMTQNWTLVIPRSSGHFKGIGANAMGMMGLVWVASQEELYRWKAEGLANVLSELGVPQPGFVDSGEAAKP